MYMHIKTDNDCVCVHECYTCAGVHGGQKRVSVPWYCSHRQLSTTCCGSWELNLGPVLLAAEPSSLQLLSESLYFNVHI